MKHLKRALLVAALVFVLQIIATVVVSYQNHGSWQFSDYYTKPVNLILLGMFFVSTFLSGLNKDQMEKIKPETVLSPIFYCFQFLTKCKGRWPPEISTGGE